MERDYKEQPERTVWAVFFILAPNLDVSGMCKLKTEFPESDKSWNKNSYLKTVEIKQDPYFESTWHIILSSFPAFFTPLLPFKVKIKIHLN